MIEVVIFDLDGLLADTEELHKRAYQDVLSGMGATLSDEYYEENWIRSGKGITDFLRHYGLSLDVNIIRRDKSLRYRELVMDFVQPMAGARELLALLHGRKVMALATSSYTDAADAVMTALDIRKYFHVVAAYENVVRVKPSPELFLYVSDQLKVRPDTCLVMEDSEKGVLAAHAAGMKCIAVPNRLTCGHDLSKASKLVSSLKDVTIEMIDSIAV